jgi:hypothetical protein
MPIKYNFTKYDELAESIHELTQKKGAFSKDEETLRAEATLIASFASTQSWETHKIMEDGNPNNFFASSRIKEEHRLAQEENWKKIRPMDIQEVAGKQIKDNIFYIWLSVTNPNGSREKYKTAWTRLKQRFNEECDGIKIQQR